MKNLLLPLLAILLIIACGKESTTDLQPDQQFNENLTAIDRGEKVNVCHNGHIINVSVNALAAHIAHNDAVDGDGDGYFNAPNDCGLDEDPLCDNNDEVNPGVEEVCDNGVDDNCDGQVDENCCEEGGVFEFEWFGPLFVALADELGLYTQQQAINKCEVKDTGGCDWYLPNESELLGIYRRRNSIGGFDPSGYYSSSRNGSAAIGRNFANGVPFITNPNFKNKCRCVRR